MSYTSKTYSNSFKALDLEVERKASEIKSLLLKAGFEKETLESIAYSNARLLTYYNSSNDNSKAIHLHLVPHPKGWALISEDALTIYYIYDLKNDALVKARIYAKSAKLRLYIHSPSGNINDYESFVVNRPQVTEPLKRLESIPNDNPVYIENKSQAHRAARWLSRNNPVSNWGIFNKEEEKGQQLSLGI